MIDSPDNKAVSAPALVSPAVPVSPVSGRGPGGVDGAIRMKAPDGRDFVTASPVEAAHLHRALSYRFVDADLGASILSTH